MSEAVLHALYEAAELEHNLMCTYLYAAFSLRGAEDGLAPDEAEAAGRWRQALFAVAIEEMSHLAAVWNITSALGGSPRVGRTNFPIDPGMLPASVVVKLAPFNAHTLQHFIYLERPAGSDEPSSRETEMLPVRDGVLSIDPQPNGPLAVRGNLEIMSGTGRVVARVTSARLCRCGGSANKPFCDGTHAEIGFRSE